jgi:hypothetical protein
MVEDKDHKNKTSSGFFIYTFVLSVVLQTTICFAGFIRSLSHVILYPTLSVNKTEFGG